MQKPGLFTTVQDLGRYGFQRFGVPISGAMDNFAFLIANLLVGNQPNDACLEITLQGPELEFLNNCSIAITGANLSPMLDGKKILCWRSQSVQKGDVISFGKLQGGCRAYLAFSGGINVPVVMNSRSTFVRGELGGLEGRPLKTGDAVNGFETKKTKTAFMLPDDLVPSYPNKIVVDVVLGPQIEYFTDEGVKNFLANEFIVTPEFDRMGYRLDGLDIERAISSDMVSDALPPGSVQVPLAGKPVVIMRDAQTTGGYPKIGVIATQDISIFGQAKPNDRVRFSEISSSSAKRKYLEYLRHLQSIEKRLLKLKSS